jgi:ABC-type glutathione transport system ATPase component
MTPLLQVDCLQVSFGEGVHALRGITFSLERGDSMAVVGETGSGKWTIALCLSGLIQPPEAKAVCGSTVTSSSARPPRRLRSLRWSTVALALQNTPFNPASTVGAQIAEPLRERLRMSKSEASQRAAELAEECWCGTPISCPAASDGGRH